MIGRGAGLDAAWIRSFQPVRPGAVRLICLPHAGGSASFYLPLAEALAPAVGVLAVQYPGRQDRRRETSIATIEELADQVHEVLRPIAGEPLALFGHSMGAVVAFEVARRLRRAGSLAPIRLMVSGRRPPSAYRNERVHRLPDADLIAELRLLGAPNLELLSDPEIAAMVMPSIRSDYQAIESYRYRLGPKLDCPMTVLVGDQDPRVSVAEARSWAQHTTGATEVQVFPGGHFFLAEQLGRVANVVAAALCGPPVQSSLS
jgi:surfactin synthase thioesterase subunit